MCNEDLSSEIASAQSNLRACGIISELNDRCTQVLSLVLQGENGTRLAESFLFASDLEVWCAAIGGQFETELLKTAVGEYILAALNVCQGQYRNSFKGLRLVLELCLQSSYLSANLVLRAEWLKGENDTIWAILVDSDNGPLSARWCRSFCPDLLGHVEHFRKMAQTLYRELSECIHGNVPNHIPLPTSISFSQETFELWLSKAELVRLIVHFTLALRYLSGLSVARRAPLENAVMEQLGHISFIRAAFEGN